MQYRTHILFILSMTTIIVLHAMDSDKTGSTAVVTLPSNYENTLISIFKKHQSFDAAAPDVRALATQDPSWKQCLDDRKGAGSIIEFAGSYYVYRDPQVDAHDVDEEFDPIALTVSNALCLDTPGAYAWCKKRCTKDSAFVRPVHNYLKALCGDAVPNIATITKLLDMKVIDLNVITDLDRQYQIPTALTAAAVCGHHNLVSLLIAHGADVNISCPVLHMAPLSIASLNGHVECVQKLIDAKADLNAKHRVMGMTALAYAETRVGSERHDDIIKLLKNAGAQ